MKLNQDFFESLRMRKLRSIAGGDTYTIIYLKLLLASINTGGSIHFEGIEDNIADELALMLNEDTENVRITIQYLCRVGLAEMLNENDFLLPEAAAKIGSESGSAERVRQFREKKALHCNADVTQSNALGNKTVTLEIEKDIDKDIDKRKGEKPTRHKYGQYQNVMLSDEDLTKLKAEFPDYQERIERLSEYMASTGKSYKSHLATIRAWSRKDEKKPVQPNRFNNFKGRDYDYDELEKLLLGR